MKTNIYLRRSVPVKEKSAKLILPLLFVLLLLPQMLLATIQEERITLEVHNVTIREFIAQVQKLTKLDIVYASNDIDDSKRITYRATGKLVTAVLKEGLAGTGLDYKLDKGIITIFRSVQTVSSPSESSPQQPVPSRSAVSLREIRGEVIDGQTKQPLPSAAVYVENTFIGTATDANGMFLLSIPSDMDIITVQFMGFKSQNVNVKGKTAVTVVLDPDVPQIDEVVVTGMFKRKQNTYSGAVNTIKSEELKRTGSLNVLQAVSQLDPSFQILVNDNMGSNPNVIPDIQMRGAASFSDMKDNYISSPNQPLFIVDGFEQTLQRVMDMDMNRVESVTLLKDATAKAIYGAKGANGVVVIETRKPQAGVLRFSYNFDMNIQAPVLRDYNRTNAREKLEVERLAGMYTSSDPKVQLELYKRYENIYHEVLRGVNTDWLAQPTRVGVGHKHSLTMEGGDDRISYSINLGYNDINGVMKGSFRNTLEGGINFQYRYKSLIFREQFTIVSNKGEESPYGSFEDYAKMNPYWRVRNERGNLVEVLGVYDRYRATDLDGDGVPDAEFRIYNPMLNASTNYLNRNRYADISNNFYVEWSLSHGFKITGRMGINQNTSKGDLFYPSTYGTLDPGSPYNYRAVRPDAPDDAYNKRGRYTKSYDDRFTLSSDVTLNYSKMIGRHLFFFNTQYNISQDRTSMESYTGIGFANNAKSISQAKEYEENAKPFGKDTKTHEMGVVASLNYSFDSRYMLDANYRASASSLFGANNRWGHFWSAGAGWNVHREKFMSEVKWIDNMKIRGSFGYTGSQNFATYLSLATYSYFDSKTYDDVIGAYLLALSNPDLKWQQTRDANIGIDLSFFKRLDLSFDYYVKTTSDLITPITTVTSTGFNSFTENLGKSENKGIELRVNYRVLSDSHRDIHLSVFGNLEHNRNKLLKIGDALDAINQGIDKEQSGVDGNPEHQGQTKPRVEYAEGVSLSAIWGVRSLGIDPFNGREVFLKKDGTRTYEWNPDDKVVLGDNLPKVQGTFGLNFDYKGFILNASFSYRLGGQYYNQTLVNNVENADLQYNVDRRVFAERWNPETPGVPAKYKRLERNAGFSMPSSRFVQDYNELKLNTLNLGYDFRNCYFMQRVNAFERLRISFAMNDILRFSTVKAERGISYPYAQSFIFSLQATF